ncbi:hypothetical protein B0J11DRAFT_460918, partial [Dendryphion nanum]
MVEDHLEALEKEFCPPVDSALIPAIWEDYKDMPNGLEQARQVLELLKQSALLELNTDFDPSGSSGQAVRPRNASVGEDSESLGEDWATETTNLSNDISVLSVGGASVSGSEDSSQDGYFKRAEQFDTPTKELLLAESFPSLRFELITRTLRKCNGDFEKATDELLNHVYFEDSAASPTEETVVTKGIDAFSEEHHIPRRKRGKGKKKQKGYFAYDQNSSSTSDTDGHSQVTANKWLVGNRDVDFIAAKTKLSTAVVASLYHANGASLTGTIVAIVEKDISKHNGKEPDAQLVGKAVDITSKYPYVEFDHAAALIRITAPSLVSAHELAEALAATRTQGKLDVIPQYAPVQLAEPTPETTRLPTLPSSASPYTTESLHTARSTAFNQASAAYRKGRSNANFRGVASYYSQIGRDANANLKAMNEVDADLLVASQSTPSSLDLHGVSVQSATRISSAKVKQWWNNLGEERIPGGGRRGVGEGYKVITGVGRHSEGGRGKIGPAVARTLVKEGWKVEINGGEILVLGRARR